VFDLNALLFAAEYFTRNARRITSATEDFFAMSLMAKLTLITILTTQTMMNKCCSVSRNFRPIDENNDIVNGSWIVFRHGMVAKLTATAKFSAAEDFS